MNKKLTKELKELLCSESNDDRKLAFIIARKQGVSVRSIDYFILFGKLIHEAVIEDYDDIAKEYIWFNLDWNQLRYSKWKEENDE